MDVARQAVTLPRLRCPQVKQCPDVQPRTFKPSKETLRLATSIFGRRVEGNALVHDNAAPSFTLDSGNSRGGARAISAVSTPVDSQIQAEVGEGKSLGAAEQSIVILQSKTGKYAVELEVARRAVQLSCQLSQKVQARILLEQETADKKKDRSLVTIADWGVQAVVSWVLGQAFGAEGDVKLVAEEDTEALKGRSGFQILQRVVSTVNDCLAEGAAVGVEPPEQPLGNIEVLKLINRGNFEGGSKGRFWVLDPVDGTLGFTRGDQYAVALALVEDGEVVLGVLGCPNFPMRKEWLHYHHRYHRLASRLFPPTLGVWDKGIIVSARKGCGTWMEPLVGSSAGEDVDALARPVNVSAVEDPAFATFCEPVEKGNSSQEYTASLAQNLGMSNKPLRVYSMAKYAAIARGDAEIFMKFARAGYREKIWDHAAGVIVVEEAGGTVTDAGGKPLDFSKGRFLEGLDRGIVASCGQNIHATLMDAIDKSWDSAKL